MMAGKGKVPVINVAVCGLTSSSFQGMSGQGAGKSVLCNRFIRSNQDDLRLQHNSVLNLSEFGSNVINNTHFLYWGEKSAGMDDGQTVKFQVVEHTEFVDDSSLKPFPHTKPYHKRVNQQKLQSSGKTTYIEPDQLSLPEEYTDAGRFPDKFSVDGFIVCVDVSTDLSDPSNPQKEFFDRLLSNIMELKKKPIVVAMTKYDRANEGSVAIANEIVAKSKKQIPMIEVSALKGVNVELCFLVLAHLVDTRKPRSKMVTYSEAKSLRESRIHNNEESFQKVLDTTLTHFDTPLNDARKMLEKQVEFKLLTELCGTVRVNRLITAKLRYLKQKLVKRKEITFMEMLPHIFEAILPSLELNATVKSCKEELHCSTKFPKYFVDVKDWKDEVEFLNKEDNDHVPFELLDEDTAEDLLQKHIDNVLKEQREEAACAKIIEILNHSVGLQPGIDSDQLWKDLGVDSDARFVPQDRLIKIYHDHMVGVEQECLVDLEELLLESHDIFDSNISSEAEMITRVSEELKDRECYKRLDKRPGIRHSQILKHIGGLQLPDKSIIYGKSHLADQIRTLIMEGRLSREGIRPPCFIPKPGEPQWVLDAKDQLFNLSILARTMENAITLRSDFMNHLSGGGTCQVEDRTYQLEISLFVGEDIETMTNENFVPQGAVVVVNTMECLEWLEKVLERHWIPKSNTSPPYRGMPLIILALDKTADPDLKADSPLTPLHQGAKRLANSVQCVCVMERPTPQPKRLVVKSVIRELILSLMNGVTHGNEFFNSPLHPDNPRGLNIAVCTLRGDPYPMELLLTPWLNHQLVSGHEGDTAAMFVRNAIDKQHRTCTLTFHSALNLKDVASFVRLGVILVYSTARPASLAIIKSLLSKLPNIPKLVVAMATNGSHDNKLLEEGRGLANAANAMFVYNSGESLPMDFCSDFLCKCWFSRFTSYNAQEISDEIRQQLHGRKQGRRLPERPSFLSSEPVLVPAPPPPQLSSRHSIGALLDKAVVDPNAMTDGPSVPVGGTLPRPPSSSKHPKIPFQEEESAYSDPIELVKGLKQKKQATLERQKITGRVESTPHPFLSPTHTLRYSTTDKLESLTINIGDILQNGAVEGDYASVQDAVKIPLVSPPEVSGSVVPLPQYRGRSPSMSPPPIPRRGDHANVNGIGEKEEEVSGEEAVEDPNATYATVQKPVVKKKKTKSQQDGYDRLLTTVDSLGYDHLIPLSDDSLDSDSAIEAYATVDSKGPAGDPVYATVDSKPSKPNTPPKVAPPKVPPRRDSRLTSAPTPTNQHMGVERPPRGNSSGQKFAARTPPPMSNSPLLTTHQRTQKQNGHGVGPSSNQRSKLGPLRYRRLHASADCLLNNQVQPPRPPLPTASSGSPSSEMYSTVQKSLSKAKEKSAVSPKRTVTSEEGGGPLYSVPERKPRKTPPPVAPKPRGRQTPSPVQGQGHGELREGHSRTHCRSESLDAGLSTEVKGDRSMAGLSPELRSDRSMSTGGKRRVRSSATPPETTDVRTASLPKDFRGPTHNGVGTDHFRSAESLLPPPAPEEDEDAPVLPERKYSVTEMGLEDEAPPLPPRNYSWSDIEDNDDELFQSDDDLDDTSAPITISDHQKIYSSISRLSMRTNTMSGIEDIYNVVNRIAAVSESTPQEEIEETAYDTLENVVKSIRTDNQAGFSVPQPSPSSGDTAEKFRYGNSISPEPPQHHMATTPPGLQSSTPLTPRELKVIKQQQKLLEKLQKKTQKETNRRRQQEEKKRGRDKKGKKGKKGDRSRYFGSPIESVVEEDGVPLFVKKCVQMIEERGLRLEGIYRVSGKKEDCLALQEKYDEDSTLDIGSLGYCENAISSTLKAFFKLLPDPLISDDIAAKVLVVNSLDADSQRTRIHEILSAMPRPNLRTLKYLTKHLHMVYQNQDINKMTASNLAIVFWPTLMRPPLIDLADSNKQLGWQLIMTRVIEHPDFIPDVD